MSNHKYLGPGNIIIDTCDTCDLIWLDYGELSKVVVAPGKDRGEWHQDRDILPREEFEGPKKGKRARSRFAEMLIELIEGFLG
jgi:Zn-finger nucleic acid-binding protein